MGFFDKMFEKKECAICGTELGLLGKTKINEGYLCKECVGKLSPFFGGYRSSTADDIREQLAYRETKDGERESYDPPRYDLDYDFNLTIHVNTPYFTEIDLRVNDSTIEQRGSIEYREAKRQATEVRDALVQLRQETRDSVVAAKAPKTVVTCPFCGATTIPDASGRCEYCGGAIGA